MIKKSLEKASLYFSMTALFIMCIVLILQILARYILRYPFTWTEELARYLYVIVTFSGLAYTISNHLNAEVTFIFEKLPKGMQTILNIITNFICMSILVLILINSIKYTELQSGIESVTLPITLNYIWVFLPAGTALTLLAYIIDTIELVKNIRRKKTTYLDKA